MRHLEGVLLKCKMSAWVPLFCVTLTSSGWVVAILKQLAGVEFVLITFFCESLFLGKFVGGFVRRFRQRGCAWWLF